MAIKILKRECRSWEQAWRQLEAKYGNRECYNEDAGESWQYMSTAVRSDGRVEHQFRHRALPGKAAEGGYEYFSAHGTYDPEDYQ